MPRHTRFTLVHLITCAVLVLIFGAFTIAISRRTREADNRFRCAKTLRSLGLAMKLYANENRGQWPRTTFNPQAPRPVWGTPYKYDKSLDSMEGVSAFVEDANALAKFRPAPNDVTAALYLLIATQDISTYLLVCPSSGLTPLRFGENRNGLHWTNFPGDVAIARHLSYSYANPYFSRSTGIEFRMANILQVEIPLLADLNPGVDELLTLSPNNLPRRLRAGNSRNHGGEGQNIVFTDGHVEFAENPFAGVQRDNIYTANGPEHKHRTGEVSIIGTPADANDAVMLPTWKAVAP